jgi:hypothetical protein
MMSISDGSFDHSDTVLRVPGQFHLVLPLAVGFGPTGGTGKKAVPVWIDLFPPFGFLISRFRPPRPLAIAVLLMVQNITVDVVRRR